MNRSHFFCPPLLSLSLSFPCAAYCSIINRIVQSDFLSIADKRDEHKTNISIFPLDEFKPFRIGMTKKKRKFLQCVRDREKKIKITTKI